MKENLSEQYAVITGASQGLGKAFALELAKKEINLILVSLPNQNLLKLSKELSLKYTIKCEYYETDLSDTKNILDLSKWLNENFNIYMLINNAGIGGSKNIEKVGVDYIDRIIQVNIIIIIIILLRKRERGKLSQIHWMPSAM